MIGEKVHITEELITLLGRYVSEIETSFRYERKFLNCGIGSLKKGTSDIVDLIARNAPL